MKTNDLKICLWVLRKTVAVWLLTGLSFISLYAQPGTEKTELNAFMEQKGYHAIPLTKFLSGHLGMKGQINNVSGIFILDTGAGATVVEQSQKDKFGLKSFQALGKAVGAGGESKGLSVAPANSFSIGDGTYHRDSMSIYLMDLTHVNAAFKQLGLEPVDGVVGADILGAGKAVIDYANLILYLKN